MFGKNVSSGYLEASFAQAAWPFCFGFDGHVMFAAAASLNEIEDNEVSSMGEPFVNVSHNRREIRKRTIIAARAKQNVESNVRRGSPLLIVGNELVSTPSSKFSAFAPA